jgi:hypothetical protein
MKLYGILSNDDMIAVYNFAATIEETPMSDFWINGFVHDDNENWVVATPEQNLLPSFALPMKRGQ